ncbi:hypothetical protein BC939DRAFT_497542 [Gamsiella multidivaricata]|uniref:uncharacterized protein n=1 Tax=Gamsiella multidivaricata TaxID=101098 RepID=UPI00221F252E|nr:uncharacterized protein BC939DRAFT_497542 [Gamsiella multidivaricata]KAI7816270.1 hypothetical protein BC939DRAFT_497542 [Gamsiella multidivaricata]
MREVPPHHRAWPTRKYETYPTNSRSASGKGEMQLKPRSQTLQLIHSPVTLLQAWHLFSAQHNLSSMESRRKNPGRAGTEMQAPVTPHVIMEVSQSCLVGKGALDKMPIEGPHQWKKDEDIDKKTKNDEDDEKEEREPALI